MESYEKYIEKYMRSEKSFLYLSIINNMVLFGKTICI